MLLWIKKVFYFLKSYFGFEKIQQPNFKIEDIIWRPQPGLEYLVRLKRYQDLIKEQKDLLHIVLQNPEEQKYPYYIYNAFAGYHSKKDKIAIIQYYIELYEHKIKMINNIYLS